MTAALTRKTMILEKNLARSQEAKKSAVLNVDANRTQQTTAMMHTMLVLVVFLDTEKFLLCSGYPSLLR